jgi:intracellular sulfur oxidation DsrE/DsrF family protein
MPPLPVAVAPPSRYNPIALQGLASLLLLVSLLWMVPAIAQQPDSGGVRYVADIELQSSKQLTELLQRASQLLLDGVAAQDGIPKVSFVLHGPVIKDLLKQNYAGNLQLVNLAASLSALQVVEIKVCRTWMSLNDVDESDLQPFVVPVNLAGSEVERLREKKNYLDF